MIQMEQLTVVLRPLRRSLVQERPTQEFVLDFACQPARCLARHLELLVGVVVQVGVLGHLVLGHPDAGTLEDSVAFARLVGFQAEILEVVDTLGVHELDELSGGAPIRVAELALKGHVVVLDGAACEAVLKIGIED